VGAGVRDLQGPQSAQGRRVPRPQDHWRWAHYPA
jgi:hypothetical protein